jgi:RNA polymerase sigma-70 factor (ECF subfamily)
VSESDRPPGPPLHSFDFLYESELEYVWKTLGRLGVGPNDLHDAMHDVFVVVYRRWDTWDRDRPVRPWLFGIARKVAANRRRREKEVLETPPDVPHEPQESQDARDLLWRALARLDDERREVVVLHDLEGYTGLEIAALLEIPANTVHSRLRLARAELVTIIDRLRGPQ